MNNPRLVESQVRILEGVKRDWDAHGEELDQGTGQEARSYFGHEGIPVAPLPGVR